MKNVLVCVTGQRSCARLISYGKELIDGDGGNMMVVHIAGYELSKLAEGDLAENLEFLHRCAVEHECNLTIIRSDNVVATMVSLINKFDIRDTEAQKVKDIADYMAKYPESKVVVTGYADAGTGNDKINDRLAAQRADAVVKALKEQYGISESRISYDSKGARVQPFAENDLNRVSICIAE
jgi:hypothetical protein